MSPTSTCASSPHTFGRSAKTAEFARLFSFFETFAARKRNGENPTSALDIPADIAPLLKNLSNSGVLTERTPQPAHSTRTRTLEESDGESDLDEDIHDNKRRAVRATGSGKHRDDRPVSPNSPTFPLGNDDQFPFTFKMMLHKLYNLEDWAKKVMNVVEESQKQYKPLAEEMITMRPRAKTITSAEAPGDMRKRSGDECRALKKRCVGRKKSVSHWAKEVAAQGEGQGTIRGGWFYDSAVSSVDVDASQLTLRARRQSIARMESIFSISQRMCEGNKTEATVSVLDADAMGRRRSIAMKRPFHA